jgi:hypothetical protein
VNWLGVGFDVTKPVSTASLRYLYIQHHGAGPDGSLSLPFGVFGVGASVGMISLASDGKADGAVVEEVYRGVFVFDPVWGLGAELAAGAATGPRGVTIPVASAGVFASIFQFLDFGYSYGFPMPSAPRPDWLASHMFSAHFQVPLTAEFFGNHNARPPSEAAARAR